MASGPFVKVYRAIVDDPMFERVFDNDHALATWLRMLLDADAMYPASAPMAHRNSTVRLLIDCGLVIEKPGNRYSIRGLQAERERRSDAARNAAAVRWQSARNASALPNRTEKEQNRSNGLAPAAIYDRAPGEAVVPRHEGQHPDCLVCESIRKAAT